METTLNKIARLVEAIREIEKMAESREKDVLLLEAKLTKWDLEMDVRELEEFGEVRTKL